MIVSFFRKEAHFYACSLLFSSSLRNSWALQISIQTMGKRLVFARIAYEARLILDRRMQERRKIVNQSVGEPCPTQEAFENITPRKHD
jgi:hypothetical protein